MAKPFRFGVFGNQGTAQSWPDFAREAEALGYSTLVIPDHLDTQLAPGPALMAAAAATTRLRLGSLVYCNDYRHPVVLAKEVATLDVLSGGRMEFGLGAGWTTSEYDKSGLRFDPPGVRIERMVESVAVLRGLMADGPLTHEGKHYRIQAMDGHPKPVQRPGPPILIGGGGKRVLSAAARLADIVSINVNLDHGVFDGRIGSDTTRSATQEKIGWIREAAGSRFDSIELEVSIYRTAITDDREPVVDDLANQYSLSPAQIDEVPHFLVGSVDRIVSTLEERRELYGFSYIIVMNESMRDFAPVVQRLSGR